MIDEKPKKLVAQKEQEKISRNVLIWLNKFPDFPTIDTGMIQYEILKDDVPGIALSTIQAAYILQRYILGGYKAEYQFKLIYRLKATSPDKRLKADELLNRLGGWAADNKKSLNLGSGIRVLSVGPTTNSSLFAMYKNGDEDHQILMNLNYEVI